MTPSPLHFALPTCLAACGPLIPLGMAADEAPDSRKPNVVFIMTDDQGFNELGAYKEGKGKVHTPHLDELLERGMIFTNFHTNSPICVPSRYSTLTGRFLGQNPAFLKIPSSETLNHENVNRPTTGTSAASIGAEDRTLAHYFRELGYRTGMIGKWHNDLVSLDRHITDPKTRNVPGDGRDPESAERVKRIYDETVERVRRESGFDVVDRLYYENKEILPIPAPLKVDNSPWITEGAVEFIADNKDRPFFLYYSSPIPHGLVISECAPDKGRPRGNTVKNMIEGDLRATPAGWLDEAPDIQPPPEDVFARVQKHAPEYAPNNGYLTWLDDSVGAILTELRRHGLEENTIFVFMSDHQSPGKFSPYQDGVRTPFAITWERKIPPGTTDSLVGNVDILPTLMELVGAEPPKDEKLGGISFASVLKNPEATVREDYLIEFGYARAVVTPKWKYIAMRFPEGIEAPAPDNDITMAANRRNNRKGLEKNHPHFCDTDQLYDLEADPGETRNLFGKPGYEEITATLQSKLANHLRSFPHPFGEFTIN